MAKHAFKITVEAVSDQKGNPVVATPLIFRTENHDDILAMVAKFGIREDKQLSFLIGLKLLGESLLEDRDNPLYQEFLPHFGAFMKQIKSARKAEG